MSGRAGLRLMTQALITAVLVVSGGYLMVYVYRWEWNRALISGVFFLAAEMAAVASLVVSRLGRLEHRLGEGRVVPAVAQPEPDADVDVDVERQSPFGWLNVADGRLGVFVPLLMGAGVIMSAIAFVVEKLSSTVPHAPSPDASTVHVGPALPAGGLLGEPGRDERRVGATGGSRRGRPRSGALLLFVLGLLAFPAVGLLAERDPGPPRPPSRPHDRRGRRSCARHQPERHRPGRRSLDGLPGPDPHRRGRRHRCRWGPGARRADQRHGRAHPSQVHRMPGRRHPRRRPGGGRGDCHPAGGRAAGI